MLADEKEASAFVWILNITAFVCLFEVYVLGEDGVLCILHVLRIGRVKNLYIVNEFQ